MNRYWIAVGLFFFLAGVAVSSASCGSSDTKDAGFDGSGLEGGGTDACLNGCSSDGGVCTKFGNACSGNGDCCSNNCVSGSCQIASCTADNAACTKGSDCCSQTCGTNGMCTPLSTSCKTLGNPCTGAGECCSQLCLNKFCAQPSYCGQTGDICGQNTDCCSGTCTKSGTNTFGTCTLPSSGGCDIDGVVCGPQLDAGGFTDAGLPSCGGSCCSRACAPWGPTKVLVCQPASGCKPVGDICAKDSDCCGGNIMDGGSVEQQCIKKNSTDLVGVCSNPTGCKPNGDICRLQTNQCNATDNCCSGNVQQDDTCHQDNLGVPRCSYAGDAGCVPTSGTCATSADCCNLNPCVNGKCGGGCVTCGNACSTSADCCAGGQCNIQSGQTAGTCDCSDAGGTCALYGQACSDGGIPCCNNVPCTSGRCEFPIPN
jgi:hypothetical protein